jgi:thiol-disulfide isomerase/thioredoxin
MRILYIAIITLLAVACQGESDSFTVSGTAEGYPDGTQILVYQINPISNQPSVIDTLSVTDGTFSGTYPKNDMATVNYLAIEQKGNVAYFPENTDLNVTIYKDSLQASFVTGSPQNEAYREFVKKISSLAEKKQELAQNFRMAQQQQDVALAAEIRKESEEINEQEVAYKKNFIAENGNSVFSVMLISEMLNRKELSAAEAKAAIENLNDKLKESATVAKIKATLDSMSDTDIGAKAPEFSAPTPEGTTLSLNETLGKYTIIDFWASWCKPCRRENPNVVNVYEKYHDKGLNIISVSLDRQGQADRWKQAIEEDNMDWYHVSNLQFWQDPIAKQYNIRSIPATFLLDENGVIIDKNLRGPALEAKIASLLD